MIWKSAAPVNLLGEDQSRPDRGNRFFAVFRSAQSCGRSAQGRAGTGTWTSRCRLISEVDLHVTAMIPPDYLLRCPSSVSFLYKRISQADSGQQAQSKLGVEMIDRFGLLPPEVKNLFQTAELRFEGARAGHPAAGSRSGRRTGRVRPQTGHQYRRTAEDDPRRKPTPSNCRPMIVCGSKASSKPPEETPGDGVGADRTAGTPATGGRLKYTSDP